MISCLNIQVARRYSTFALPCTKNKKPVNTERRLYEKNLVYPGWRGGQQKFAREKIDSACSEKGTPRLAVEKKNGHSKISSM